MVKIWKEIECLRFERCSALICPLDPDWKECRHLDGERVCFYLTEYSKEAARPILRGSLPRETYSRIAAVYPEIVTSVGPIRKQLKRPSKNPPRVKEGVLCSVS